jgi:hypothetical protein
MPVTKNRPLSGSPNIPRIDRARQAKIPRREPAGFLTTVSLKNRHANRRPGVRGSPIAGSTTVPKAVLANLALQLPFLKGSESMGNHDSEIVDADGVG